jgi:undecaprenyl diphosphate synthase
MDSSEVNPNPEHGVRHLAIIMDGNGRWAEARRLGRTFGHRQGARRVEDIVVACCDQGITHLTLYAFSTENWNRPWAEVQLLMRLLVQQLRSIDKKLVKNRVSLVCQGSLERLPAFVRLELARVERMTSFAEPKLTLCLSLSYGGRQELVDAARKIAQSVRAGTLDPEQISEAVFAASLYRPEFPDPDLLIRTGGEYRVSNFLLWQMAYSEIFVTETLWPDFDRNELADALAEFSRRERRFGKTSAQVRSAEASV